MSKQLNIVHISQTPLVAAPSKIALAQRLIGHNAIAVSISDYPAKRPLAGKFVDDSLIPSPFTMSVIERAISEADIIHVHNDLSLDWVQRILLLNTSALFAYQVHSPLREGPLYIPRASELGLPFKVHLVVAQYQPRHYPDYVPVPNIVLEPPSIRPRMAKEKLRVMFSPTHNQSGRWNNKFSQGLEDVLKSLSLLGKIDLIWPENPVHPKTLMVVRRTCHITIDEIATGAFHQVSLEGMCAGNIVINRADFFSKAMLAQNACQELAPFVYANNTNIAEILAHLANEPEETARLQSASHAYFCKHLMPAKLVEVYDAVYKSAL